MRLEERVITIPQKIIPELQTNKIFFIAEDGTEFNNCKDCESYEHELKKKNSKVFQTMIQKDSNNNYLSTLDGACAVVFFNISSLENIEELKSINALQTRLPSRYTINKYGKEAKKYKYDITYCDFELYGPGWYMVYWGKINDIYAEDVCYVKNYANYIRQQREQIDKYDSFISDLIQKKNKELNEKLNKEENNDG